MPTVKLLDSIKILVYFKDHMPPHFHAIYNEYEVLVEIESLAVYSGYLPNKQMKRVQKYAANHQEFLARKWKEFNPNK
jgi:hypothetical protein